MHWNIGLPSVRWSGCHKLFAVRLKSIGLFELVIILGRPRFYFKPILVITLFDRLDAITPKKTDKTKLAVLPDMRQFVPQPTGIAEKFAVIGIVQMDGATKDHGHLVGFHFLGREPGPERVFSNAVIQLR